MSIETQANNPLGLTVAGPGYGNPAALLYPGQTGTLGASTGYTFATFGSAQDGINAGVNYIAQKIQGGVSTVSQLVNLFSPNDLTGFEQITGLGPNDPVNIGQAGLYAAGIAAGEGSLSAFGGSSAFTGSTASVGAAQTNVGTGQSQAVSGWLGGLEKWVGAATGNIVFVILGIVLLAAALYMMAVSAKVAPSPAQIGGAVKDAALAAA